MPARDFLEGMGRKPVDGKILFQFSGRKPLAQVFSKSSHAIRAVAIVTVEVVGDKSIHPSLDPATHPRLQHLTPMWVVQTCPVLAHAADAITYFGDRSEEH